MKRNLILTFLACGASLVLGTAAQAQFTAVVSSTGAATSTSPGGGQGESTGHRRGAPLERLTDALGLSGTQEAQVAAILEAAKPQMKAIRENFEAQRKAEIQSVVAQITPLLTPDQQAKLAAIEQRLESSPGPGAGAGTGGRRQFGRQTAFTANPAAGSAVLQRLTAELSLTPDQQSQIKPVLAAARTQLLAIRTDTTLTPEQKFAKVRETMEATRGQINGILTPAQQQQLAALRPQLGHRRGQPLASPSPSPATN